MYVCNQHLLLILQPPSYVQSHIGQPFDIQFVKVLTLELQFEFEFHFSELGSCSVSYKN